MSAKGKRFQQRPGKKDFSRRDDHDDAGKTKIGLLSDNVMSYYRNVSTSLETGFDDDDPTVKDNFLSNVYNTLKDEGVQVSQNQTVSRILEVLFSHSKPHHMRELFCNFSENLTVVTFDRFASHVFQALILHLPAIYEDKSANGSTDSYKTSNVHASVLQLCQFAESHLRDIMTHTYASHILRSLLEALGGVKVREEVVRSRISRVHCKEKANNQMDLSCKSLSRDFQQSFSALREKIVHLCNFEDHLSDPSYCPVLQTLLLILHKTSPEEYRSLVKLILDKSCVSPNHEETDVNNVSKRLPLIVQNEVGSYLIELIISLAAADELRELYEQIFKGNLIYFAVHPIANYVLQKFLSVVVDPDMMKELLSDITGYLEDILAVNHVGIITKLAQACRNTQTGQDDLIKALLTAFHCQEPIENQTKIVPLIASLQTFETFFGEEEASSESPGHLLKTVNIHGSLLLQELLQFAKPKLVVTSLLSLSPAELMGLCCDKCGSHIVDTFFRSETVLDTHRFAFLKKLEGLYVNIACNRNGSRCLESIWKGSALKAKTLMAEELSKHQDRIEGDQWGHFLYRNFALLKFSQRRKEWIDIQGASTKKQQLLNDILQGKGRKNKKRQSKEATQINEAVSELSVPEDSKDSKKRHARDTEAETDSSPDQPERKQLKKKSKSNKEITQTVSESSPTKKSKPNKEMKPTVSESSPTKKKSKPNKEMKPTVPESSPIKKKSKPNKEMKPTVSESSPTKKKSKPNKEMKPTVSESSPTKKKSKPNKEMKPTVSESSPTKKKSKSNNNETTPTVSEPKKRSKPNNEIKSTLSDEDTHTPSDTDKSSKKKRKRNKEKKRVVRNADLENSANETECDADVVKVKTPKKKRKL